MDTLSKILQDSNVFEVKKVEDVTLEKYESIKKQKTDEWIKSDDIFLKKRAVFEKLFGHSDLFAQHISIGSLGTDNNNLPECDMKDYVESLKEILSCNDPEILDAIYSQCKETTFVDQTLIERQIKNEYGKMYNEGLFKVEGKEEDAELGEGMYSAGTDFKMIITSLGAYEENTPSNYKEDWNRPSIDTQHFCASYIRNDMIGTAEIPNVCYGFNEMSEDALVKSSTGDMGSSQRGLETGSHYSAEFFTPDEQINRTADEQACDRRPYNEMDFKRVQNGQKKQPDYIVVFRKNGQIENLDNAKKAQEDWGRDEQGKFKMPIVVVDVDECLKEQSEKVDKLMEEYVKNPSLETAKDMYYTLRNNRVTTKRWGDELFRKDIDIESVKDRITEHEAEIGNVKKEEGKQSDERADEDEVCREDLIENYSRVSAKERSEGISTFRKILNKIQEIKKGDDGIGEK